MKISGPDDLTLALRNNLNFADNHNALERELTLYHGAPSLISVPPEKKGRVSHILLGPARPFENGVESYNWEYDARGRLFLLCTFRGSPTTPVSLKAILFF